MKSFVGTSGWSYDWNLRGDLQWYVERSKLNAVELNSSFYRFPFPNIVKTWTDRTRQSDIRWSVKVNRSITHTNKLGDKALSTWNRLEKLFKPLDRYIDFYLFQLPPLITFEKIETIEKFFKKTELGERFALEVRHPSFYENIESLKNIGLTIVSIDSPQFPTDIYNCSNKVYLRLHGKKLWYNHYYSNEELDEICKKIKEVNPEKAYLFFNNNHNMLSNARTMKKILETEDKKILETEDKKILETEDLIKKG